MMSRNIIITRRTAIEAMAGATGALLAACAGAVETSSDPSGKAGTEKAGTPKGRIRQSVCRWCYSGFSLDDLCRKAAAMGIESIDLLGPDDWPTVKNHGLTCGMANGPGGITEG